MRAPGSKDTLKARIRAGSGASTIGSCHTSPVNQSEDAFLVGLYPDLKIFIKTPLKIMRIKDAILAHYSF